MPLRKWTPRVRARRAAGGRNRRTNSERSGKHSERKEKLNIHARADFGRRVGPRSFPELHPIPTERGEDEEAQNAPRTLFRRAPAYGPAVPVRHAARRPEGGRPDA